MQSQKTADVYGGINTPFAGQNTPSKFFKPISILMTSFALAVSGFACGGSEDDDPPELEFIAVPGGEFTLTHDTTAHKSGETLTMNAFSMAKTPVTVAQFKKCVDAGSCRHGYSEADEVSEELGIFCNYNRGKGWKNHPMNCISHDTASSFCEWIGGRLPTDEEWEYAATHNGQTHLDTEYPWGDTPPVHCETASYAISDEGTGKSTFCNGKSEVSEDEAIGTSEVGTYSPAGDSPLGFVDMMGNVKEWTDSRSDSFISNNPFISNSYATKGVSWYETYSTNPDDNSITSIGIGVGFSDILGFRCVK